MSRGTTRSTRRRTERRHPSTFFFVALALGLALLVWLFVYLVRHPTKPQRPARRAGTLAVVRSPFLDYGQRTTDHGPRIYFFCSSSSAASTSSLCVAGFTFGNTRTTLPCGSIRNVFRAEYFVPLYSITEL